MEATYTPYARSFYDALSLARNSRDQAMIYYCKEGVRAAYEAIKVNSDEHSIGALYIQGRCVTAGEVPENMQTKELRSNPRAFALAIKYAKAAQDLFVSLGIDVTTGWDVFPPQREKHQRLLDWSLG